MGSCRPEKPDDSPEKASLFRELLFGFYNLGVLTHSVMSDSL